MEGTEPWMEYVRLYYLPRTMMQKKEGPGHQLLHPNVHSWDRKRSKWTINSNMAVSQYVEMWREMVVKWSSSTVLLCHCTIHEYTYIHFTSHCALKVEKSQTIDEKGVWVNMHNFKTKNMGEESIGNINNVSNFIMQGMISWHKTWMDDCGRLTKKTPCALNTTP